MDVEVIPRSCMRRANHVAISTESLLLLCIAACFAGISKTGVPNLGTLVAAGLAITFPAKASIGLLLPMLITADIVAVMVYRESVMWKNLASLIPWVLSGIVFGYVILGIVDNKQLSILIGVVVLVLLLVHLIKQPLESKLHVTWFQSPVFHATLGGLAGFTTMVGNAAGGIMAIYFLSKGFNKQSFIATGAWFFLAVNLIKVPFYIELGVITADSLILNAWMIPFVLLGTWIGVKLLKVIPEKLFQYIVLVLAAVGGVWLLVG
jgi:uncharacterized membrane protein YfcA